MSQKKFHAYGFNDGIEESRASRIGFKRYLRELEEESCDFELLEDDQPELPNDKDSVIQMLDLFIKSDSDLQVEARKAADYGGVDEGVDFLFRELERWLEKQGHTAKDADAWVDQHDSDIWDHFNGLI